MDTRKIVGTNLRHFREQRGLSQIEFGKVSGFHPNYIGDIEHGKRNISVDNLTKIAEALELPIHILFIEGAHLWLKKTKRKR
jgi:transcriptional regulator with XRE-family HTH domain